MSTFASEPPVDDDPIEWNFYPDNGHFYAPRKSWWIHIGRGDGTFGDGSVGGEGLVGEARLMGAVSVVCESVAAAKELAQSLQNVLDGYAASSLSERLNSALGGAALDDKGER